MGYQVTQEATTYRAAILVSQGMSPEQAQKEAVRQLEYETGYFAVTPKLSDIPTDIRTAKLIAAGASPPTATYLIEMQQAQATEPTIAPTPSPIQIALAGAAERKFMEAPLRTQIGLTIAETRAREKETARAMTTIGMAQLALRESPSGEEYAKTYEELYVPAYGGYQATYQRVERTAGRVELVKTLTEIAEVTAGVRAAQEQQRQQEVFARKTELVEARWPGGAPEWFLTPSETTAIFGEPVGLGITGEATAAAQRAGLSALELAYTTYKTGGWSAAAKAEGVKILRFLPSDLPSQIERGTWRTIEMEYGPELPSFVYRPGKGLVGQVPLVQATPLALHGLTALREAGRTLEEARMPMWVSPTVVGAQKALEGVEARVNEYLMYGKTAWYQVKESPVGTIPIIGELTTGFWRALEPIGKGLGELATGRFQPLGGTPITLTQPWKAIGGAWEVPGGKPGVSVAEGTPLETVGEWMAWYGLFAGAATVPRAAAKGVGWLWGKEMRVLGQAASRIGVGAEWEYAKTWGGIKLGGLKIGVKGFVIGEPTTHVFLAEYPTPMPVLEKALRGIPVKEKAMWHQPMEVMYREAGLISPIYEPWQVLTKKAVPITQELYISPLTQTAYTMRAVRETGQVGIRFGGLEYGAPFKVPEEYAGEMLEQLMATRRIWRPELVYGKISTHELLTTSPTWVQTTLTPKPAAMWVEPRMYLEIGSKKLPVFDQFGTVVTGGLERTTALAQPALSYMQMPSVTGGFAYKIDYAARQLTLKLGEKEILSFAAPEEQLLFRVGETLAPIRGMGYAPIRGWQTHFEVINKTLGISPVRTPVFRVTEMIAAPIVSTPTIFTGQVVTKGPFTIIGEPLPWVPPIKFAPPITDVSMKAWAESFKRTFQPKTTTTLLKQTMGTPVVYAEIRKAPSVVTSTIGGIEYGIAGGMTTAGIPRYAGDVGVEIVGGITQVKTPTTYTIPRLKLPSTIMSLLGVFPKPSMLVRPRPALGMFSVPIAAPMLVPMLKGIPAATVAPTLAQLVAVTPALTPAITPAIAPTTPIVPSIKPPKIPIIPVFGEPARGAERYPTPFDLSMLYRERRFDVQSIINAVMGRPSRRRSKRRRKR